MQGRRFLHRGRLNKIALLTTPHNSHLFAGSSFLNVWKRLENHFGDLFFFSLITANVRRILLLSSRIHRVPLENSLIIKIDYFFILLLYTCSNYLFFLQPLCICIYICIKLLKILKGLYPISTWDEPKFSSSLRRDRIVSKARVFLLRVNTGLGYSFASNAYFTTARTTLRGGGRVNSYENRDPRW